MDDLIRAALLFWLPIGFFVLGIFLYLSRDSNLTKKLGAVHINYFSIFIPDLSFYRSSISINRIIPTFMVHIANRVTSFFWFVHDIFFWKCCSWENSFELQIHRNFFDFCLYFCFDSFAILFACTKISRFHGSNQQVLVDFLAYFLDLRYRIKCIWFCSRRE